MRECIFFLCLWCGIIGGAEAVSPGIQHFDRYRSLLEGKKVGIVANQTAVLETGDGYKHSVDFLRDHRVQLIRIFCPEHGFRGDADAGETVITGIGRPVYRSFPYTERRKNRVRRICRDWMWLFSICRMSVSVFILISLLYTM